MYANSAALPRPELSEFLEEAQALEKSLFAEKVMPVFTSKTRVGRYPRIRIANGELLKRESTLRAPRGSYNEIERKFEWDTFECVERGLEQMVDDVEALDMEQFFSTEQLTSKLLRRSLMIDQEIRVAQTIMDPVMFNATQGSVAYTEANIATIDFARDFFELEERMLQVGVKPNTMIMSRKIWNLLRRSGKLQTFLFGNLPSGQQRLVTPEDMASVFGLSQILIASGYYDSGRKNINATVSLENMWGTDYIAVLDVQSGQFEAGGVGRTIVWGADCPGGLYSSESYRCERRRGDMLRVRMHTTEKVTNDLACQLITTQYA